jgi:hypothetical protein
VAKWAAPKYVMLAIILLFILKTEINKAEEGKSKPNIGLQQDLFIFGNIVILFS